MHNVDSEFYNLISLGLGSRINLSGQLRACVYKALHAVVRISSVVSEYAVKQSFRAEFFDNVDLDVDNGFLAVGYEVFFIVEIFGTNAEYNGLAGVDILGGFFDRVGLSLGKSNFVA